MGVGSQAIAVSDGQRRAAAAAAAVARHEPRASRRSPS